MTTDYPQPMDFEYSYLEVAFGGRIGAARLVLPQTVQPTALALIDSGTPWHTAIEIAAHLERPGTHVAVAWSCDICGSVSGPHRPRCPEEEEALAPA